MLIDFTDDPRKAYSWMASVIAPRPIAWVSTRSKDGVVNLAPFSFFQMITGKPPTLMISPLLQSDGSIKDTTRNIIETGEFVVNLVSYELRDKMNETSFSYPANVGEAERCNIAMLGCERVQPPRVASVAVSFECRMVSVQAYPASGPSCHIILGEVLIAHIDDRVLDQDGHVDPKRLDLISRMGGDWYGRINSDDNFTMPRPVGWDKPAGPPIQQHAVPIQMAEAVVHHAAGRVEQAEAIYRRILGAQPNQPDATSFLGSLLFQKGGQEQGLQLMRRAIELNPNNPTFHRNLGANLRNGGDLDEAIAASKKALALDAAYPEAHFDLGECYRMQDRLAEAETAYQQAVNLKPDYLYAYAHLALVQQLQRKFDIAEVNTQKTLELDPQQALVHMNLGVIMQSTDRNADAVRNFHHALQLDPQLTLAYHNLSVALRDQGYFSESEVTCLHALALDQNYPDAHFQYAFLLLQKGEFAQGWREYEWRWQLKGRFAIVTLTEPRWQGVEDLAGKTILIHMEQGFGDTLQFARYAKLLSERGATVWLAADESLRTLMSRCVGVSGVFCSADELPATYDYHCPLLSLPLAFHTELSSIPAEVPYLSCDPALSRVWLERIGQRKQCRVGLVWAGGHHNDLMMVHIIDRLRSLQFDQLSPLLEIEGVEFFSLQLGDETSAQLAGNSRVKDFTGLIRDFHDTAALIDNLDLVISVDTSVAHLAGALGKPVWMLNRYNSCWRWLIDRTDSPWYPSMRIFRQPTFGDWHSVIGDVARSLRELVAVSPTLSSPAISLPNAIDVAAQDLQMALSHHQSGRLSQAEALYRSILAAQPRHADAMHYLGMLAHQTGRQQEAITLIRQAIDAASDNPLYHYNLGTVYRQHGDLASSIASYRQAILLKENFADAHYKLGISYQQAGQVDDAEASYWQTLAINPDYAGAHNNLGSVLHAQGRIDDAEASYRQALRIQPNFADAYLNLGNLLKAAGNYQDAEMNYRMALQLQPNFAPAHSNLGVLLMELERYIEAEQSYQRALELLPDFVEVHTNLGFAMVEQHRFEEAEASFRRVLQLQPESAEGHNNLAIVLRDQDKLVEAEASFRKAVELNATFTIAYNHLGNLLKQLDRFDDAEAIFRTVLDIDPDFAEAHNNLAVILQEGGSPTEAELHCRRALQINPRLMPAHYNLSLAMRDQGRFAEAEASCLRALELDPDSTEAQFHHACLLLQKGAFAEGWRKFESRWLLKDTEPMLNLAEPQWFGETEIAGKTIALCAEQGFGDVLQMSRYASVLAGQGAKVLMVVPEEIKSLMARCPGVSAVYSSASELPYTLDFQCPLMSLPLALRTELATIPATVPYLSSDTDLAYAWQVQIGPRSGLRVGLVWAGSSRKHVSALAAMDRLRSLQFDQLSPLLEIEGVEFFSLQIGAEASAQLKGNSKVKDFTGLIRDFHDTAALIENLDLVLSVDTSVAHLAGALGKPVWMLNRYNSCWRWLIDRTDSPWYPTMRIFGQPSFGDWHGVINDVAQALRALVSGQSLAVLPPLPPLSDAAGTDEKNLQMALEHHQAGRLAQAESLYRNILGAQPRHADTLHYLGMLAHQTDRQQDAITLIRQAIDANPDSPLYHYNLGTVYRQHGDLASSIASYQRAIALKDNFADAHYKLGISYQQEGQLSNAEASYRQALAINPNFAGAHNNLGSVLQEQGRVAEAEASYRQALRINPGYVDAFLNFGNLLKVVGNFRDAEMHYRMALQLQPNNAKAHSNLGLLLTMLERHLEAEPSYQLALELQPDSVEVHINLGFAMAEQHRFTEAEASFRHALRLQPNYADAYNNLGIVLREQNRFAESEASFRRAIELNASLVNAYNNLGNLLREFDRLDEAEACYLQALQIKPDYFDAHLNLSFVLLQRGDFARGWAEYEYRWMSRGNEPRRAFAQPMWTGDADLRGKAILLHAEQGLGDTLHFVRYATLLKKHGAKVYVFAPASLKSLLASCDGVTAVYAQGDALPPFDFHCPMMSLPMACKTEVATIPNRIPYLAASQLRAAHWRKVLGKKTALRVGVVWAGSPRKHQPAAHLIDRQRSMHFDQIKPLLDAPGVQFFSLQLGDEASVQSRGNVQLIDHTWELRDFEESAALIDNLDLVISVDTSVAHLAGAVGKPVWLLNRYNTCWRWFSYREDSPWYPGMRIFRQPAMGDWDGVIQDVKTALEQLAAKSNSSQPSTRAKPKKKR